MAEGWSRAEIALGPPLEVPNLVAAEVALQTLLNWLQKADEHGQKEALGWIVVAGAQGEAAAVQVAEP